MAPSRGRSPDKAADGSQELCSFRSQFVKVEENVWVCCSVFPLIPPHRPPLGQHIVPLTYTIAGLTVLHLVTLQIRAGVGECRSRQRYAIFIGSWVRFYCRARSSFAGASAIGEEHEMVGLACCRSAQAWSCALISSDMQVPSSSHSLPDPIDIWIERGLAAWPRDHSRDALPTAAGISAQLWTCGA